MGQRHALVRPARARRAAGCRCRSRAGRGGRPAADAAELALEALDRVEQLQRLERGLHAQAGVQEARLVGHLADGVGVVGGGAREHRHAAAGSASTAACSWARRSPTLEPSPSSPRPRWPARHATCARAATPGPSGARRLQTGGRAPSRPSPERTGIEPGERPQHDGEVGDQAVCRRSAADRCPRARVAGYRSRGRSGPSSAVGRAARRCSGSPRRSAPRSASSRETVSRPTNGWKVTGLWKTIVGARAARRPASMVAALDGRSELVHRTACQNPTQPRLRARPRPTPRPRVQRRSAARAWTP